MRYIFLLNKKMIGGVTTPCKIKDGIHPSTTPLAYTLIIHTSFGGTDRHTHTEILLTLHKILLYMIFCPLN